MQDLLFEKIIEIPELIRQKKPLIHMLPNSVTVTLCTDGISALGARPLMAYAPEEMAEIASYADAVVVNMGQPDNEKYRAAEILFDAASKYNTPLVWDPVGAGASEYRKNQSLKLLEMNWNGIIKGNRSEAAALFNNKLLHHGIDSVGNIDIDYTSKDLRTWAVSGNTDYVFDSQKAYSLSHLDEKKVAITGTGCLTGAIMGCCYAVEKDPLTAAMSAFLIMGKALSKASENKGYGSRKTALLDELSDLTLTVEDIQKIQIVNKSGE